MDALAVLGFIGIFAGLAMAIALVLLTKKKDK